VHKSGHTEKAGLEPGLKCFRIYGPEGVRTPDLMTASSIKTRA